MTPQNRKLKRLRNKADRLWGQAVLKLHPNCEGLCGRKSFDPHHFIEKSLSNALRYDIKNGIGLCRRCHYLLHNRADGTIYANIVLGRGQKWADYIKRQRKKIVKTNVQFYEQAIKELQGK